ncbi:MAG: hypothetical protein COV46_09015 [Deltaproteobacteria bacterium CG11_big_fil_rev_8_21_14_0_20_49_13]|nr:MAG: hypothetical protein COV46_09015 [Deltaproteobacteria bacterium CG11_big_fil_rev_8_21_14_0_20_49_13]
MAKIVSNNIPITAGDDRYKGLRSPKGSTAVGTMASDAALKEKKVGGDEANSHLKTALDRMTDRRVKTADPKVTQSTVDGAKSPTGADRKEMKAASETRFADAKEMAKGFNHLANGTVPKTDAKQGAQGHETNAQANLSQQSTPPQGVPQKAGVNPNLQNTIAMAQGTQAKPVADAGVKPPVTETQKGPQLKEGAKVAQEEAVKQPAGAESGRTTASGEQAGKQLANLQAGNAAVASAGAKETTQLKEGSADNVEETEKEEDKADTPEGAYAHAAGHAKKFNKLAMSGSMGGGVGGDGDKDECQAEGRSVAIHANKIADVQGDMVTHLEMKGAGIGFRVISPTADELGQVEMKLASVQYQNGIVKSEKPKLTLEEVVSYNKPDQKLVELIVADAKDTIEDIRTRLNTCRTSPYGKNLMCA